jgi:hypothetical protein
MATENVRDRGQDRYAASAPLPKAAREKLEAREAEKPKGRK